jgi:histidine triad (HIT) family protein
MVSNCIFCRIVAGEIPANVIYRDALAVAFHDLAPQAPTHALVIPVRHVGGVAEIDETDTTLAGHLLAVGAKIACDLGLQDTGYRVVVNQGRDGGQTVGHLHLHVLGGRAMAWPPG